MNKSYVTMEQHMCAICGKTFDTGSILLDKRLRKQFEHKTVTREGLCPEHQQFHDNGYITLIGIDPDKSVMHGENIKSENAYRTGKLAFFKRTVAKDVLNISSETLAGPYVFVEHALLDILNPELPDTTIN